MKMKKMDVAAERILNVEIGIVIGCAIMMMTLLATV